MKGYGFKQEKHCRWCGKPYTTSKPPNRDGFCDAAHRQAHYRAYKKYVTGKAAGAQSRVQRCLKHR